MKTHIDTKEFSAVVLAAFIALYIALIACFETSPANRFFWTCVVCFWIYLYTFFMRGES